MVSFCVCVCAALAVTKAVLQLPVFQRSKHVSCYLSMPTGELDTTLLVKEILNAGKTLYVPKVDTPGPIHRMHMLRVAGQDDLDSFPVGLWGIREPGYQLNGDHRPNVMDRDEELDLILVPGVAFDESMARLGHGKGYYDRFLSEYIASTGRPRPLLVALALKEQILKGEQVPMIKDHDWSMDFIVGPDRVLGGHDI